MEPSASIGRIRTLAANNYQGENNAKILEGEEAVLTVGEGGTRKNGCSSTRLQGTCQKTGKWQL